MNYVDDGYVIDDLRDLARKEKGNRVSIQWLPKKNYTWFSLNKRIRKSIRYYQKWLPEHMQNHGINTGVVKELRTDVFLTNNRQVRVESYVRDSRGKEYVQNVVY
jgi:hypothetical protein